MNRYPDYYQVIKQPISLKEIKKGITDKYFTLEVFEVSSFAAPVNLPYLRAFVWQLMGRARQEAFRRMFDNARTYNEVGSWVYDDADEMQKIFEVGLAAASQRVAGQVAAAAQGEEGGGDDSSRKRKSGGGDNSGTGGGKKSKLVGKNARKSH